MKLHKTLCYLLLIYSSTSIANIWAAAAVNETVAISTRLANQQAEAINETSKAATSSQQQSENSSLIRDLADSQGAQDELMSGSSSAPIPIDTARPSSSVVAEPEQDELATLPTMTSVHHQVWTSSSSGSLDELSPEIISKLRGDVPFLAAYALRPRLVGAASSSLPPRDPISGDETGLQVSASQGKPQRQASLASIDEPKLSDFNELKVETSSSSKSEHHHKRRTTLKKRPSPLDSSRNSSARRRRLILATTGELVRERRRRAGGNSRLASSFSSGRRSRSRSRSERLREPKGRSGRKLLHSSNLRHSSSIANHGRQQISPALNDFGQGKTNTISDEGGIKGGSRKSGLEPFYKRRKEEADERKSVDDEPDHDGSSKTGASANDLDGIEKETSKAREEEEEAKDEEGQLESPEPRRVGDPDVDEVEGDTVTVMPKFDGVDDDPEIPIEDSELPPADESQDRDDGRQQEGSSSRPPEEEDAEAEAEAEGEASRGNRINRDRSDSERDGTALGGGIGATVGGGGSGSGTGTGNGADGSAGGERVEGADRGTSSRTKPGVEFADKHDQERESAGDRSEDTGDSGHEQAFNSRRIGSDGEFASRDEDNQSSHRKTNSNGRERGQDEDEDEEEPERPATGDDVDYRDELDASRSLDDGDKRAAGNKSTNFRDEGKKEGAGRRHQDHGAGKSGSDRNDCHDHEHGHHHGHSHHDGIKWLQEAIPGEPGLDYPTLNRINLTDFSCRDQKYPGYYADVEARCQVFHICQADGRQDSFL